MKKRLLKFACPGCGARLAVPPEMAGLSDQCPKCGTVVTAPASEAVSAPAPVPPSAPPTQRQTTPATPTPVVAPAHAKPTPSTTREMDAWSSDALADALNPPAPKPTPRPEVRPPRDIQPDFLQATPEASPLEPSPPPRKPAHEVLDSILRKKEPVAKVAVPRPSQPAPSPFPAAPPADPVPRAQAVQATPISTPPPAPPPPPAPAYEEPPPSALMPQHLTDTAEVERASMLGMGEVLAGAGQGSSNGGTDTRPFLHVPFVPVRSSPDEERQARRGQLRTMGIICFLLIDVLAIFIWKDEIGDWINTMTAKEQPRSVSGSNQAARGVEPAPAEQPAPVPSSNAASSIPIAKETEPPPSPTPSTSEGLPLAPLPSGTLQPSMPSGGLTIASPADFTGNTPPAASTGPSGVPMAIPIPGHSTDNVPMATPVGAAPATGEKVEMKGSANPEPSPATPAPATPPATTPAPTPPPAVPTQASVPTPPPIPLSGSSMIDSPSVPSPLNEPSAITLDSTTLSSGKRRVLGRITDEAKSALDALLKFLDAPSWRERANYVQKSTEMPAALEKYASVHGDGPILVEQVEFLERYPSKGGVPPYCMFEVSGGVLKHPVLILVEQSAKNGVRVDWQAFIEFKDDLLLRFLENKNSAPQKFRVMLRRKHYFDRDVPDLAAKDSFEIEQPNSEFQGHVFLPRNSALGKQLTSQLGWSQDMPVIAELVWKSDAKAWWVEISKIVSFGWRN